MGGKQTFTIVRKGEILGQYSRRTITALLAVKSLKLTDKFKDPRDCKWKQLKDWGKPNEGGTKVNKRRRSQRGPRSELDRNPVSIGPDIFERKRRRGSFDIDAPCNICTNCRVQYDTDDVVRWVTLSCPRCGGTSFQGHHTFDSDRALDSIDRYVESRRRFFHGSNSCVACCDCSRRYSHEEKAAFVFGLCPWCGCRDFRDLR